jgi:predicted DNA-binding transcriptional regulator AlpA
MAEPTKYLDEDAVAALLSVSVRTIQRWRGTGQGPPFVRAGARRVIYNPTFVEAWVAARTFAHRADEISRGT